MLTAVSGDAPFLARLAAGTFSGRVHSIFAQVINIVSTDDELYSLTTDGMDPGPLSLRVAIGKPWPEWPITAGDAVLSAEGILTVGSVPVVWRTAAVWQGILPSFPRWSPPEGRAVLDSLAAEIRRQGRPGGMLELLLPSGTADVTARTLKQRAENLLAALAAADWPAADTAAVRLLGLGGGLTPSGDDFCCGLLMAVNMAAGPFSEEYRRFGQRLVLAATSRTTDISAAMLRQAATGRARERVLLLLRQLASGDMAPIKAALAPVLAIGSLSGTDLTVGLYAGLELGNNKI